MCGCILEKKVVEGGGGGGSQGGFMTKVRRMLVRLEAALEVLWVVHKIYCRVLQSFAERCRVLQRVAACCSVLQRVAACCSVLQ